MPLGLEILRESLGIPWDTKWLGSYPAVLSNMAGKKHAKHFIFWCPFSSWISQTAMELMKSIEIRWYQVWPMLRLQHFDMGLPKIGGNPIPSHGEFPHFSHIFPWSSSFSDSCTAHIVSRSSKPMSTSAKEVCISGLNVEAGSSRMKILWTIINQHISLNYIYNYIYITIYKQLPTSSNTT